MVLHFYPLILGDLKVGYLTPNPLSRYIYHYLPPPQILSCLPKGPKAGSVKNIYRCLPPCNVSWLPPPNEFCRSVQSFGAYFIYYLLKIRQITLHTHWLKYYGMCHGLVCYIAKSWSGQILPEHFLTLVHRGNIVVMRADFHDRAWNTVS